MSGKYVPPALRNKKEPSLTSDDFPSLGGSKQPTKTSFKPTRSFAVLATEWNEHEEDEKIRKETRDSAQRHEAQRRALNDRNVFVYRPDTEYYNEDRPDDSLQPLADDDWQVIQKKAQRELTTEELFEKKARMEEEEKRMEEDSVWKDGNLTDWDYRDRRAYS